MQYEAWSKATENFRALSFSEIVRKAVDRARRSRVEIAPASLNDVREIANVARQTLELASDECISAIHARNFETLRILRDDSSNNRLGLFCYLPLNETGFQKIVSGRFDGASPDPQDICLPGEEPEAIYIWLAWLPGGLARSLGAIALGLQDLGQRTCPVFSRAATPQSAHLHDTMGFLSARDFYPSASHGLLVAFPERKASPRKKMQSVRVARTFEDMAQVMAIRSSTYIAEQYCLYEEEFDGNDFCATHFLGTIDNDPAGCIRIRFFADFAKIERLAVRAEYRTSRLAFDLVKAAIRHCESKGYSKLYGHSRLDLTRFWGLFGFRARNDRDAFSFANVRYVEMIRVAEKNPEAISLESNPMVLIRPEGAWDRPGPLDESRSEQDPQRLGLIKKRMRTVRDLEAAK